MRLAGCATTTTSAFATPCWACLADHAIELLDFHVVDTVAGGGRWHCLDGSWGTVDDPSASPLAMAAVLDGRRLYARRADLQKVIDVADAAASEALVGVIREQADAEIDVARCRSRTAMAAAAQAAAGEELSEALTGPAGVRADRPAGARHALRAGGGGQGRAGRVAVGDAGAERCPTPWRVEALVLLAFSAYARGDGPLAGVSLEAALRCDPDPPDGGHARQALQSGMRPEQIRELALTGYRLAKRLGVRAAAATEFGRRAG